MHGRDTSAVEVTHVSTHGFRVLVGDEELFAPFAEFPWFRHATIDQLCDVERPRADHLFWPKLDIDLTVESIRHPECFPLVAKESAETERPIAPGS